MAHVRCMVNTYGYRHTLRIYNNYCFSTATVGTPILPTVTIIRTLRVLLTVAVATVGSVAFSKAPLAQLLAHLVMCLATGAKRCGVYCGATDCNSSVCQSSVYCMTLCFSVCTPCDRCAFRRFSTSVHLHIPQCTSTSSPLAQTPPPDCLQLSHMTATVIRIYFSPHLNHIQSPKIQPIISPEIWQKTSDKREANCPIMTSPVQ